MKREQITIDEEFFQFLVLEEYTEKYNKEFCEKWEENPEFEIVHESTTYIDLEKGYKTIRVVLERSSDKKYFAFEYYDSPHVDREMKDRIAEEVFKKEKVIEIYE